MHCCFRFTLLRAGADDGIYFIFVIVFLSTIVSTFSIFDHVAASGSPQLNKEAVNGMELRVSAYDVSENVCHAKRYNTNNIPYLLRNRIVSFVVQFSNYYFFWSVK